MEICAREKVNHQFLNFFNSSKSIYLVFDQLRLYEARYSGTQRDLTFKSVSNAKFWSSALYGVRVSLLNERVYINKKKNKKSNYISSDI